MVATTSCLSFEYPDFLSDLCMYRVMVVNSIGWIFCEVTIQKRRRKLHEVQLSRIKSYYIFPLVQLSFVISTRNAPQGKRGWQPLQTNDMRLLRYSVIKYNGSSWTLSVTSVDPRLVLYGTSSTSFISRSYLFSSMINSRFSLL